MSIDVPGIGDIKFPELPQDPITVKELKNQLGEQVVDAFDIALMISNSFSAKPEFVTNEVPLTTEQIKIIKKEGYLVIQVPDFLLHTIEAGVIDDDVLAKALLNRLGAKEKEPRDLTSEYQDHSVSNSLRTNWLIAAKPTLYSNFIEHDSIFTPSTVLNALLLLVVLYEKGLIDEEIITGRYLCTSEEGGKNFVLTITNDSIVIDQAYDFDFDHDLRILPALSTY